MPTRFVLSPAPVRRTSGNSTLLQRPPLCGVRTDPRARDGRQWPIPGPRDSLRTSVGTAPPRVASPPPLLIVLSRVVQAPSVRTTYRSHSVTEEWLRSNPQPSWKYGRYDAQARARQAPAQHLIAVFVPPPASLPLRRQLCAARDGLVHALCPLGGVRCSIQPEVSPARPLGGPAVLLEESKGTFRCCALPSFEVSACSSFLANGGPKVGWV